MAFPTPEKTYEFDVNRRWNIIESDAEQAARHLHVLVKDQLLDQSHHGIGGTITEVVAGVTYQLAVNPADRAGNIIVPGSENFTTALIGKYVEIVGAASGGNNGVFQITAVPNADTIQYSNATGAAEAFTGNFRIARGNITSGNGAQMSPWKCQGSSAGTTGRGAAHDSIDRWIDASDLQSSTSTTTGGKSWFVFENTVTGAQFAVVHRSSSVSFEWINIHLLVSPELGFSGGTTVLFPAAADERTAVNNGDWCGSQANINSRSWFGNLVVSTDGQSTFFFLAASNRISMGWVIQRVADPISAGALIPWNGSQNVMMHDSFVDSVFWTRSGFNDSAKWYSTIDKDGSAGGPYLANFYATLEHVGTQAIVELHNNVGDELNPTARPFYRFGLATETIGVKGRHGRLTDLWVVDESPDGATSPQGSYFPNNQTRQLLKIGDCAIPWNGGKVILG